MVERLTIRVVRSDHEVLHVVHTRPFEPTKRERQPQRTKSLLEAYRGAGRPATASFAVAAKGKERGCSSASLGSHTLTQSRYRSGRSRVGCLAAVPCSAYVLPGFAGRQTNSGPEGFGDPKAAG